MSECDHRDMKHTGSLEGMKNASELLEVMPQATLAS